VTAPRGDIAVGDLPAGQFSIPTRDRSLFRKLSYSMPSPLTIADNRKNWFVEGDSRRAISMSILSTFTTVQHSTTPRFRAF
jgi:hypothetical protein